MPRRNKRPSAPDLAVTVTPLQMSPERAHPRPSGNSGDRPLSATRIRLQQEAALAALTECLIPHCTGTPIHEIGLCRAHGIATACYFEPDMAERRQQRFWTEQAEEARAELEAISRALTPGYVYYIRIDDRIKVGFSTNVRQRMRAYPPHSELLAVHPGTKQTESDMHKKFAVLRVAGREWFTPGPALMAHIDAVTNQYGPPDERHIYRFREAVPASGDKQTIKAHRSTQSRSRYRRTL